MTFDFPAPMMVEGEVVHGGMKYGSRQQISGVSWPMVPPTGWRYVARKVKALLYGEGAVCEYCAGVSVSEGPCARSTPCAPVRLTILTGREAFPLTNDLLKTYTPFDRLRLIATTAEYRPFQPYAHREIAALKWTATEPEKRHELMQEVVAELHVPAGGIRTFLWDGIEEIPYPYNWARASADQGR